MKSTNPLPNQPARILPGSFTIQIAPGQRYAEIPREQVPSVGVLDWVPQGDGTYRPKARIHQLQVRLTEAARLLRLDKGILQRLSRAGFIEHLQVTPGNVLIDLPSYFAHVERCKDPDFWTAKRRAQYSAAMER
ncbi:MAG: hypothetical protein QM796_18725 [Chthoniobacteraceae bacterium]